jgi:Tfp pilus assembly PilM family ATPase
MTTGLTYGAALFTDTIRLACVAPDGSRAVVKLLTEQAADLHDAQEPASLFVNVSDRLALVKTIGVDADSSAEAADRARFELAQTLLDPVEDFYFDLYPREYGNGAHRFLAVAYHRQQIDEWMQHFESIAAKPQGFKLDAVAMCDGYRTFCRTEAGDVQALVSIEENGLTIAVLHRLALMSIGSVHVAFGAEPSPDTARKAAVELKMTISYLLSDLFHEGVTVPLSRLLVCGAHARTDTIVDAIAGQFSAPVTCPHFYDGYFDPISDTLADKNPERFLVPLGLAVP